MEQGSTVQFHSALQTRTLFGDPFTISDDLSKASYAQQAAEEYGSLSIGPGAAGGDQFGTPSLQHSERRTAELQPSSIMLMTGFDSAGTPSSTYTDTTEQASRKRPAPDVTTQQRQPAYDAETLSTVPREFRDKWDEVAGQETLA